jgi:hypothetical protein
MHPSPIMCLLVLVTGASAGGEQAYDRLWRPSVARPHRATGTHQTIPAKHERVLVDLTGPGVIRHLWFTAALDNPDQIARFHRGAVIKAYWDDEEHPSVEVPFGDFFAVGHGVQRPFECAVFSMTPHENNVRAGFNCYLPMPFLKRARLVLDNQSSMNAEGVYWHIDYDLDASLSGDVLPLHVTYRGSRPVVREMPHIMCEAKGRGRYVGTVWSVHLLQTYSWVEGREDFFVDVDGDGEPTLPGTGSEDYYGQAWGYRPRLQTQYLGTSVHIPDAFGKWTAYRFHLLDPIGFQKSLRVTLSNRGHDVGYRSDDFATVTYWYQLEPHAPYPALPPYEDRLPMDHPESYATGLEAVRSAEAGGDLEGAISAARLLARRYPRNPLAGDLICRLADLLERSGKIEEAKAELRRLAGSAGPAARAAGDKLWMLEQPGRAILKAYASSGIEVFIDGRSVHKGGPWNMRDLAGTPVEVCRGRHVLAARAVCQNDQPLYYARLGTLQLWLDVPGPDIQTDKTWKISPTAAEGWNQAGFNDTSWGPAAEHERLPDDAWFRLSPPGVRMLSFPIRRVWSANCNPFYKERGQCFEELYARKEVTIP